MSEGEVTAAVHSGGELLLEVQLPPTGARFSWL